MNVNKCFLTFNTVAFMVKAELLSTYANRNILQIIVEKAINLCLFFCNIYKYTAKLKRMGVNCKVAH